MSTGQYFAVPMKDARDRPRGWRVRSSDWRVTYGSYRGPFANWRACRRARSLNRRSR